MATPNPTAQGSSNTTTPPTALDGKAGKEKKAVAERRLKLRYGKMSADGRTALPSDLKEWFEGRELPSLDKVDCYVVELSDTNPKVLIRITKKRNYSPVGIGFQGNEEERARHERLRPALIDGVGRKATPPDFLSFNAHLFKYLEADGRIITPPTIREILVKLINPTEYSSRFKPTETDYDAFRRYVYQETAASKPFSIVRLVFFPYVKKHFPKKYFQEAYKAFSFSLENSFPHDPTDYSYTFDKFRWEDHFEEVESYKCAMDGVNESDLGGDLKEWIEFIEGKIRELKANEAIKSFSWLIKPPRYECRESETAIICQRYLAYHCVLAKLYEKAKNTPKLIETYTAIQTLMDEHGTLFHKTQIYQSISGKLVLYAVDAANRSPAPVAVEQKGEREQVRIQALQRAEQFRRERDQAERSQADHDNQTTTLLETAFNQTLRLKAEDGDMNVRFQRYSIMQQLMRGHPSVMEPVPGGLTEGSCPLVTGDNLTLHLMREFKNVNQLLEKTYLRLESTCLRVDQLESENRALRARVEQLTAAKDSTMGPSPMAAATSATMLAQYQAAGASSATLAAAAAAAATGAGPASTSAAAGPAAGASPASVSAAAVAPANKPAATG